MPKCPGCGIDRADSGTPCSVCGHQPDTKSSSTAPKQKTKSCPFCSEQILFAARKCKHCGEFLDGSAGRPSEATTIEKTSKTYKGRMALGVVLILAGTGGCFCGVATENPGGTMGVSFLITVAGLILYFSARIGAWWHHG